MGSILHELNDNAAFLVRDHVVKACAREAFRIRGIRDIDGIQSLFDLTHRFESRKNVRDELELSDVLFLFRILVVASIPHEIQARDGEPRLVGPIVK